MTSLSGQLFAQAQCGWQNSVQAVKPVDEHLQRISRALNTCLKIDSLQRRQYGLVSTAKIAQSTQIIIASIVGHPRWKRPQWREFSNDHTPTETLVQAYQDAGPECLTEIQGSFSFILIDTEKDLFFAGVDRMNRHPLYYCATENGLAVASSPNALFEVGVIEKKLKPQGIYNYLYFHMIPSPDTLYEGLRKLPAGHYIQSCDGKFEAKHYWQAQFSEDNRQTEREQAEELKEILRTAVADEYQSDRSNGSFLSGGLDSSTVTGVLSEQQTCPAYSMGFSAQGYDEIEFARATAKHFGVELHEYYVTPKDIVEALPKVAAAFDEPFGNSSALPTYLCAKFASERGTERLLAGDGGDELFAGNERYAKQRLFEHYQRAPQAFRERLLEPAIELLPQRIPLVAKARSYIAQAKTPLPDRLQSYNFLHRNMPTDVFEQEFLDDCCLAYPLDLLRDIYRTPQSASALNRMMFMDWQITLADNDLRKVGRMCELAGVEVGYPLLHDDLVEFSTRIPSDIKLKDNQLRHFFKAALTGWLPDSTINKSKHGFGLPFGVWMRDYQPLRDMAYEALEQLKKRGFFKPHFIDNTLRQHRDGHAAYYGELIWLLMTLELWLQEHGF